MGAAPIHHRSKYETDDYGLPVYEMADYVEWNEVYLTRWGTTEANGGGGYKYITKREVKGGFVDSGIVVPEANPERLSDIIARHEHRNQFLPKWTYVEKPVFSRQPRKKIGKDYRPELEYDEEGNFLYEDRPSRAEWLHAGIVEKGAVPLHDDEPILDSWWVLGAYGPGLLWVSI